MATHVTEVENESTHMTTSSTFGELLLSYDRSRDRELKMKVLTLENNWRVAVAM